MQVLIKGSSKEIAALVLELQERQTKIFIPTDSGQEKRTANQKCVCR